MVTTGAPVVVVLDRGVTVGLPLVAVVVPPIVAALVVDVPGDGVGVELQEVEAAPLVHVVDTVGAPLSLLVTVLELTLLMLLVVVITGAPDKPLMVVTVLVDLVV